MAEEGSKRTLRPITDEDRSLCFAFLKFLKDVDISSEQAEVVSTMLGDAFNIDPNGIGGTHDLDVDILELWKDALAKRNGGDPMKDEKFLAFLDLLKKKGYFNNCEEGSDEYNSRLKKAYAKFQARNNPYEGLSAEQLKTKGNELVAEFKYKDALAYYSKAIELDGSNHIYYANRAAAHSYLKDYRSAILDCEKAININPKYAKAHSRLGHALFHETQYARAAQSYRAACDLDPSNETYKTDLKLAEDQLAAQPAQAGGWPGMPGMGMPGMPGMGMPGMPAMDPQMMNQLMSNPDFMNAAMKMMQNPNFSQMMSQMYAGGAPDPQLMNQMMAEMGPMARPQLNQDGTMTTPFGEMSQDDLRELIETDDNPKFAAIREDVRVNGMAAFNKYYQDPEFMGLVTKLMSRAAERNRARRGGGGDGNNPPPGIA
jgi:small glutamine-rich tetratricopeptide repeat-containing protein alpha